MINIWSVKMSEWISVEDRLPKDGEVVIAGYIYEFSGEVDAFISWFMHGKFTADVDALEASNSCGWGVIEPSIKVTHWAVMPKIKPNKSIKTKAAI